MHQFFVAAGDICGGSVSISGAEGYHLAKVLRLAAGDEVAVADGAGRRLLVRLERVTAQGATAMVLRELPAAEPPLKVFLLQGLPKSDKLEFLIQKGTELGVTAIFPLQLKHCVKQLKGDKVARRVERWQKIAWEAAKQCGRSFIPDILPPASLAEALAQLPEHTAVLVPWEGEHESTIGRALADLGRAGAVALIIGPEGGLAPEEIELIRARGGIPVTLGPRILRTETAALAALTVVMHRQGDLGGQAGD